MPAVHQPTCYLEKNNICDDEQFGYREGRLVTSAGVDFIESVIDSIDAGELIGS